MTRIAARRIETLVEFPPTSRSDNASRTHRKYHARAVAGRKADRLDERLVRDGLAESRPRAQALIRTGRVLVDDVLVGAPRRHGQETRH